MAHCGRRTHSSSSHRTSHLSGGWRTRCRSYALSCCPLPHPAPHLPRRAGAAGRPGHYGGTCAPCTLGPCCECQGAAESWVVGGEVRCSARCSAHYRGGCNPRTVEASSEAACWWREGGGSDTALGCEGQQQRQQGILKPGQGKVLPGWWAAGEDGVVSQRIRGEMGSATLPGGGGRWGC